MNLWPNLESLTERKLPQLRSSTRTVRRFSTPLGSDWFSRLESLRTSFVVSDRGQSTRVAGRRLKTRRQKAHRVPRKEVDTANKVRYSTLYSVALEVFKGSKRLNNVESPLCSQTSHRLDRAIDVVESMGIITTHILKCLES
jgi:hypothetical protein